MKTSLRSLTIAALAAVLTGSAVANNITVSNVTLTDLDTIGDTVNVRFDVTWENSWRVTAAPANWDAAWLFIKYHTGDLVWRHATLDVADVAHTAPAGGTIRVGQNTLGTRGTGVFLHRSAPGTGTVNFTGVKLKWRYGMDAVADAARVSVDVTGIEMVYIPQGSFFVGDGLSSPRFGDSTGAPFQVVNAGPISVGTAAGSLSLWIASSQQLGAGPYQSVPATYPNGFNAFYCMKHEPSQGERGAAASKGGPQIDTTLARQSYTGNAANTPDRAFTSDSGFTRTHPMAYLDWVGLRPMTDLEYEKACRGSAPPVAEEFAWGNALVAASPYTLANDGTPTESIATGYRTDAGNAYTVSTRAANGGTTRVGVFALGSYSGAANPRIQSGATYYGIMDMTGSGQDGTTRWRFPLSATSEFVFAGEHGDGGININSHNVAAWGSAGQIGTSYLGFGLFKGGSWVTTGRAVSVLINWSSGTDYYTVRGVRTAP